MNEYAQKQEQKNQYDARPKGVIGHTETRTHTEELTELAAGLKERLAMLNAMIEQKFSQFFIAEPDELRRGCDAVPCRPYPPAFDKIRDELSGIEYNIMQLGVTIERIQI